MPKISLSIRPDENYESLKKIAQKQERTVTGLLNVLIQECIDKNGETKEAIKKAGVVKGKDFTYRITPQTLEEQATYREFLRQINALSEETGIMYSIKDYSNELSIEENIKNLTNKEV